MNIPTAAKTVSKTMASKEIEKDPFYQDLKKGFDDIIHGRISIWKPPFK